MLKKMSPLFFAALTISLASCGAPSTPATANASAHVTAQTTTAPTSNLSATHSDQSAIEAQLLQELNAARAVGRNCGNQYMPPAPAVTWNSQLANAARKYAADMATRNFFSHYDPEGLSMKERAAAAGYNRWVELGENLAAGQALNEATESFLKSPSHCQTLMDPALKEVGIGYVNQPGSRFGTYFVQNYGTR